MMAPQMIGTRNGRAIEKAPGDKSSDHSYADRGFQRTLHEAWSLIRQVRKMS